MARQAETGRRPVPAGFVHVPRRYPVSSGCIVLYCTEPGVLMLLIVVVIGWWCLLLRSSFFVPPLHTTQIGSCACDNDITQTGACAARSGLVIQTSDDEGVGCRNPPRGGEQRKRRSKTIVRLSCMQPLSYGSRLGGSTFLALCNHILMLSCILDGTVRHHNA